MKDTPKTWTRAADLGCGTGLSGLAFIDIVEELVGVDLSPEMIEKAKQRRIYHELHVGEMTAIFSKAGGNGISFDLIFVSTVKHHPESSLSSFSFVVLILRVVNFILSTNGLGLRCVRLCG